MKTHVKAGLWMVGAAVLLAATAKGMAQETQALAEGSRILYVDKGWGDDGYDGLSLETPFATISKAVAMARVADTIFIYPGLYKETVDLSGKALILKGIAGPRGVPIIEAPGTAAILVVAGEGKAATLQNLVIRNSLMGVCVLDSSPTLQNLTIVCCSGGVVALGDSQPRINNCIFWANSVVDLSGAQAHYSCLQWPGESVALDNIYRDPLFVDPNHGDYHLKSKDGHYVAALDAWMSDDVTSPCTNAGDPESNWSLEPSPNGGRIDMGAYGGTRYASLGSNLPPTVKIIGHGFRGGSSGTFMSITVDARDSDGRIARVEFYADGVKVAEDTSEKNGWSAEWPVPDLKSYVIQVVAEDDKGARTLSEAYTYSVSSGSHGTTR